MSRKKKKNNILVIGLVIALVAIILFQLGLFPFTITYTHTYIEDFAELEAWVDAQNYSAYTVTDLTLYIEEGNHTFVTGK